MNKIVPSLWFDTQCEEAMNYYVDTFNGAPHKKEDSKIISITRYEKGMEAPIEKDSVRVKFFGEKLLLNSLQCGLGEPFSFASTQAVEIDEECV